MQTHTHKCHKSHINATFPKLFASFAQGNNLLFFKLCGLPDWQASILTSEFTVPGQQRFRFQSLGRFRNDVRTAYMEPRCSSINDDSKFADSHLRVDDVYGFIWFHVGCFGAVWDDMTQWVSAHFFDPHSLYKGFGLAATLVSKPQQQHHNNTSKNIN